MRGQIASKNLSPFLGEWIQEASFIHSTNIYVAGVVLDARGEAVSKTKTLFRRESENKEINALSGERKC